MGDTQQESGSQQPPTPAPPETLMEYLRKDMVVTTLFVMRFCTILASLLFVVSSFGLFPELGYRGYQNALLTSFFTFSIRLYQRKQEKQINMFSKDMYALLVTEDSGHYMFYTFFYYNQYPLTIYLLPPFFYAILFSVNYTTGLARFLPTFFRNNVFDFNGRIVRGQVEMRRFVAYTEIFLLVVAVWNVFAGYMFILAPFIHYQFVRLRYQSVRNNSVAYVFSELRLGAEFLSRHPSCPSMVATLLTKGVAFISGLAPSQQMRRET